MYDRHCCGADMVFDQKGARKEMEKYIKKGPGRITRKLLAILGEYEIRNKTLLDVGGGIGAISWFFLEKGGSRVLDVDASGGYLHQAEKYAAEKGLQDQCHFLHGNFSAMEENIGEFDFVTLDKVICCYPDYRGLLDRAIASCSEKLVLSFPVRNVVSRLFAVLSRVYFYLHKNPFRTYIHSPHGIRKYILSRGFSPVHRSITFPWHVQVYQRDK